MSDASMSLDTLTRPRLMVVSARYALAEYDRRKRLPRLLGLPVGQPLPKSEEALERLIALERAQEQARRHHDASWRAADHVAIITALLHEVLFCAGGAAGTLGTPAPESSCQASVLQYSARACG